MKKKIVWRYYCEYCKKSNCSASSIKHHEERCTMNPNRRCGMCEMSIGYDADRLAEAKKILDPYRDLPRWEQRLGPPKRERFYNTIDLVYPDDACNSLPDHIVKQIRDITESCPACILAAIRQSNISVSCAENFSFQQEGRSFLDDYFCE